MSERLDLIKSLVLPADVIADVGCDHGRIAEYCAKRVPCKTVIASDVSDKCLLKAKTLLSGYNNVEFKCCDGIAYECDEAVIAGMGGILIADIIRAATVKPKTLILSPHRDHYVLRKTLCELGYGIDRDIPINDRGKFYAVIRAVMGGGNNKLSEIQMLFGAECDVPSEALRTHLKKLYSTYSVAADKNKVKLDQVVAAMRLQNVAPDDDAT